MLIYSQQNFTALGQLVIKYRQKHTVAVYLRLIIAMHFPVVNKKAADAALKRKVIARLIITVLRLTENLPRDKII